ncbi:hypothetical protein ACJX0J_041090, partial [Zea mays]
DGGLYMQITSIKYNSLYLEDGGAKPEQEILIQDITSTLAAQIFIMSEWFLSGIEEKLSILEVCVLYM